MPYPGGKKDMSLIDLVKSMSDMILGTKADESQWTGVTEYVEKAVEEPVDAILTLSDGKSGFKAYKQTDGRYRWVGWVSNQYRDRDNPREILSSAAHKEYVEYADQEKEYPELWLWHVPGSRIGKTDWLDFSDGFLLSSGLFDEDKESVIKGLESCDVELAMSHGFKALKHDPKEVITDKYRMREITILPASAAANVWTKFEVVDTKEENMPISKDKKEFLAKFLPADTITAIEETTTNLRKSAEEAGVDWKEVKEAVLEDEVSKATQEGEGKTDLSSLAEQVAELLVVKLDMKGLSDMLVAVKAKADTTDSIVERLDNLDASIKALKETDDAKVAKAIMPKSADGLSLSWMNKAASHRKETEIDPNSDEDTELAGQKPAMDEFLNNIMSKMGAV
jgi:hypothetical protein